MHRTQRLLFPKLASIYNSFAPFTEPLIRLVAGGALAVHGYTILFEDIDGATEFLESAGFEDGLFWAYLVGLVEFVCGLCLAAGLLTRLVAVPIIGFLMIAILTYHWQFGFSWENRGFEYPLFWIVVVSHFMVHGGGKWSLDALIRWEI